MSSEHVEVLWAMLRKCVNERLARKSADREAAALAAAIEALKSAPPPPAEAQPVAWRWAHLGDTHYTDDELRVEGMLEAGIQVTPLYAHPPPSAPVGAGEVDCRCVDCGGNQPGHDPTCSYMHELHGEAQPVGHGCGDHDHADYIPGCGACAATLPEKRTAQPPSAPVGDDPIDASGNAEYIEHCADRLERCGLRVTAGALRVIAHEHRSLAQQPAAVGGDNPYPAPRNRQEAAALAKLALAYLGVTSAHIDAVVARCETDLAAQQGGAK